MNLTLNDLENAVRQVLPRIVELRRSIHREPDLSRKEKRTARKVAKALEDLPLRIRKDVFGSGMIVDLEGGNGKRTAFRGDMDALPLKEQTGLPYASTEPGAMHACGHDCHTAILAGTAMVLCRLRDSLPGPIRLLFQPSEEDNPRGGARGMIEEGALEGVDSVLGLHLWPDLPLGEIGFRAGSLMAASDHVTINLKGLGSHAAKPHMGIDSVITAAYVATALQTLVSRRISPFDPAVLTFGRIEGGCRYNVIADSTVLDGTCRTFSPEVRHLMEREIGKMASSVASGFGAQCEVDYRRGYPAVINDAEVVARSVEAARELEPHLKLVEMSEPSMIAEDFAFFAQTVPSAFFWLGCRPAASDAENFPPLHNPSFAPDEGVLEKGILFNVLLAMKGL